MNHTTSKPLLIWSSILVGLQVLTGGAALSDTIGVQAAGMMILAVGALQAGTQFYVNGKVVPTDQVAAAVIDGQMVAGPAASPVTGTPVTVVTDVGVPPRH